MTTPLRAARWTRVSSRPQSEDDRNGLPVQNFEIDRAITEHGWTDTGLSWSAPESGATVHNHPQYLACMDGAGTLWDVLVVAYTSRFGRLTMEALRSLQTIEERGASIYFVADRLWTRDEGTWTTLARQFVEDEAWRRRHRILLRQTYESRYRRRGTPAARPPMGYSMNWEPNEDAPTILALFERYATNTINIQTLGDEFNLKPDMLKNTLKNKAYLGHSAYRFWDPEQPRLPLWKRARDWTENHHKAIVSQELFDTVQDTLRLRTRAGGRRIGAPHMLSGKLRCQCDRLLRLDGRDRQGRHRIRHLRPLCPAYGTHERRPASYYVEPIQQAFLSLRFTPEYVEQLVAQYSTVPLVLPRNTSFAKERRAIREAALDGRITIEQAQHDLEEVDDNEHDYIHDLQTYNGSNNADSMRATLSNLGELLSRVQASNSAHDDIWRALMTSYIHEVIHIGPQTLAITPTALGSKALIPQTFPNRVRVSDGRWSPRADSNRRRRP